jgi:hypothetical protein
MTQKVNFVFNGWLQLSQSEKQELIEAIRKNASLDEDNRKLEQRQFSQYIEKSLNESRILGPVSQDICTCCGR